MSIGKAFGKLLKIGTLGVAPLVVNQLTKGAREERRDARAQMGRIDAERASIEGERVKREGELTSRRNKMALGMARMRKNRGGFGFGSSQPSANQTKSTLG
jgi:hypothetical protein